MNLFVLNMKLLAGQKMRLILLVLLMLGISIAAGFIGNLFLTRGIIDASITIAVVDLDDSLETRMILNAIAHDPGTGAMFDFVTLNAQDAKDYFENGYVAAIFTLPQDFGRDMRIGVNSPFSIYYNTERQLTAALVQMAAEIFADMLRSAQTGVYVSINYAREQDVTGGQLDIIMMAANMRFLGLIISRGDMFTHQALDLTYGLGIWDAYFAAMFFALMLCASFVTTETQRRSLHRFFMIDMKNRGIPAITVFAAVVASNAVVMLPLNIGVGIFAFGWSFHIVAVMAVGGLAFAAFAAMLVFLFDNAFSAGCFAAVVAAVSLVLSGGVIPIGFFAAGLRIASYGVLNTWLVQVVSAASLSGMAVVFAFIFLFVVVGYTAALRRGRMFV